MKAVFRKYIEVLILILKAVSKLRNNASSFGFTG